MKMDLELIDLLGFWYLKNIDRNASLESFRNFINLACSNTDKTLDFATFLKYIGISYLTAKCLKDNNDYDTLNETIRMLNNAIANVKKLLKERFLEIQNNLLEELKLQYQMDGLDSNYEEIIIKEVEKRSIGGRN